MYQNAHTFLDVSKAFDCADHNILFYPQISFFLMDNMVECSRTAEIKSFLTVTCGVPHGSVLGPSPFLIYNNYIAKGCTLFHMLMIPIYTLCCPHLAPQMHIEHNVGLPDVDNWQGRLSRTFWKGPCAQGQSAVIRCTCNDRCTIGFIILCICAFHGSSCPIHTVGQTGHDIYTGTFPMSMDTLGRHCCWAYLCRKGLVLSLLQAQTCGNHYTWKREVMNIQYCYITFLNGTGWTMFSWSCFMWWNGHAKDILSTNNF